MAHPILIGPPSNFWKRTQNKLELKVKAALGVGRRWILIRGKYKTCKL